MNRPCKISFHEETAPLYGQLSHEFQKYVCEPDLDDDDLVLSIYSQYAFYIDFTHGVILRAKVTGEREGNPIDFPTSSISFVEWYYGTKVPPPLTPYVESEKKSSPQSAYAGRRTV